MRKLFKILHNFCVNNHDNHNHGDKYLRIASYYSNIKNLRKTKYYDKMPQHVINIIISMASDLDATTRLVRGCLYEFHLVGNEHYPFHDCEARMIQSRRRFLETEND
jgi:hypothetical protein